MTETTLRYATVCSQCSYAELVPVGAAAGELADTYAWKHSDATGHTTIVLAGLLKSAYYRLGERVKGEVFLAAARVPGCDA